MIYVRFAPESGHSETGHKTSVHDPQRTFRRYQSDDFCVAEEGETVRRLLGYTTHHRNLGRRRLAGDVWAWEE